MEAAAAAERRRPEEEAALYPQAGKAVAEEEQKQKEEKEKEKEEEEESPVAKRRRVLCSEFTAITSSDSAVARSFLASNDWHIEKALNAYFEPPMENEDEAAGGVPTACAGPGRCIDLTADATSSDASVNSADSRKQEDDSSFSLITWNIDGLDQGNLKERAGGICSYLALYSPDVVFLQEVVPPHLCLLQMKASNYTLIPGKAGLALLYDSLKQQKIFIKYSNSAAFDTNKLKSFIVDSNLASSFHTQVSISGNELCLMTSHLESTKDHSKERMKQLQIVFKEMQKESESTTAIFGGDTNLRDSEVAKLGNLPNNIMDIWEFLGKPQHCRYTWDTHSNTNLHAAYKCKMRFDRIYFRPAGGGGHIIPRSMDLIGLEKLDCGRFPSDHWGVLCNFDVIL